MGAHGGQCSHSRARRAGGRLMCRRPGHTARAPRPPALRALALALRACAARGGRPAETVKPTLKDAPRARHVWYTSRCRLRCRWAVKRAPAVTESGLKGLPRQQRQITALSGLFEAAAGGVSTGDCWLRQQGALRREARRLIWRAGAARLGRRRSLTRRRALLLRGRSHEHREAAADGVLRPHRRQGVCAPVRARRTSMQAPAPLGEQKAGGGGATA
jgi:hypothetical protein